MVFKIDNYSFGNKKIGIAHPTFLLWAAQANNHLPPTKQTSSKVNCEEADTIRLKYNPEVPVIYRDLFPNEKLHSPGYYDLRLK
jgi:hypothetical protein